LNIKMLIPQHIGHGRNGRWAQNPDFSPELLIDS